MCNVCSLQATMGKTVEIFTVCSHFMAQCTNFHETVEVHDRVACPLCYSYTMLVV